VPVRHVLLGALAFLVLGLAVYLFFEVRSSPAAPQQARPVAKEDKDKDKEPVADKDTPEAPPKPHTVTERTGGRGSGGMISRVARKAAGSGAGSSETAPTAPDNTVGVKLDALMSEANRAFDKQDFDEAKTIALKVLKQSPNNPRMLRIMVTTACIGSDVGEAQKHYNLLTSPSDREQMKTRCSRDYGVTLVDKK
jgi:hypothetical protein